MKKINFYINVVRIAVLVSLITLLLGSCNKFIDTPKPVNEITSDEVFNNDGSIAAAISGAYATLASNSTNATTYPALFADEAVQSNSSGQDEQAQNNTYNSSTDYEYFINYYTAIYQANDIIESLSKPGAFSSVNATRALGEAYFLRAFCYFKLVNFYGPVPLVVGTNVNVTSLQSNTPVTEIYTSMVNDLNRAGMLVTSDYPDTYKGRVNQAVVYAMLAKVDLYKKDWAGAETAATNVINSGNYSLEDVNGVFLAGSKETIWQFWNTNGFTYIGSYYIPSFPSFVRTAVSNGLFKAFEAGDKRKTAWLKPGTGSASVRYYPYKYKQNNNVTGPSAEYEVLLRLGELYLIRAEARANQNDLSGSLTDLNMVRQRAGLPDAASSTSSDLLPQIEQERRVELMFEQGNRWFDLNRTGRTAFWLTPIKPTFKARAVVLPIPITVIQTNPNLKQNPGY